MFLLLSAPLCDVTLYCVVGSHGPATIGEGEVGVVEVFMEEEEGLGYGGGGGNFRFTL